MGTVAVYCRISKDREGRAEGVETQGQRGRDYAAQHWPQTPVVIYADNDLTAADPDVERPGYQQLLAAIRRGEVAHIVCAEQSRLTRQPAEWEYLTVTLARAGIGTVHCYRSGMVEVGSSKLVGRILAAVNAEEVETLKARIVDRMGALAAEGRPHGGTPYAYRHVVAPDGRKHLEQIPERAEIVRETAGRLLAGWSLSAVAVDLAARQVPTAKGGVWRPSTVRSLLVNPTVAGMRTHRGKLTAGTWEPVIDADQWRALQHLLTAPVVLETERGVYRASRARPVARRRYLLTGGVAVCGVCDGPLSGLQRQTRSKDRVAVYGCRTAGCFKVSVSADPLEAEVAERLCRELDRPGFWDAYAAGDDGRRGDLLARLAVLTERQAAAGRGYGRGELDETDWRAVRAGIREQRDAVERALADLPPAVVPVDGAELRADWDEMLLAERRAVIERHVASVTVGPAVPGAHRFDPKRVTVTFR